MLPATYQPNPGILSQQINSTNAKLIERPLCITHLLRLGQDNEWKEQSNLPLFWPQLFIPVHPQSSGPAPDFASSLGQRL